MAQSAQIAKVNPWHQRFADWLILDGAAPGWNKRAAEHFGRTPAWISTVYHSDAFQDFYRAREAEYSKELLQTVQEKIVGAAGQAIDALAQRLTLEADILPYDTLLETVDILGRRSGLGEGKGGNTVVNNIALVSREELQEYRDRMRLSKEFSKPKELIAFPVHNVNTTGEG